MTFGLAVEDPSPIIRRLHAPEGAALLDLRRTSNARDLRGALVSLAYSLAGEPQAAWAVCALTETRLSADRVQHELEQFRSLVGEALGRRLFLVAVEEDRVLGQLPSADPAFVAGVVAAAGRGRVSRVVPRQAVISTAMQAWLDGRTRLSVADLRRITGASYPTVAAALKVLERLRVIAPEDKGYEYAPIFAWETWQRLAEMHSVERKTIRFSDPSGLSRTPYEMAKRVNSLQSKGSALAVEIGGVLGAEKYYPSLDITAASRLDLCVYDGDIGFVRNIDAGLVQSADPNAKAVLVVHLAYDISHRRGRFMDLKVASAIDCLADLLEIGYQAEAADFIRAMQANRQTHGGTLDA
jgi:hypothetical protein